MVTQVIDGEWRTDDMSLAAYLRYMSDADFLRYEWDGKSCFMVFERSNEILRQAVDFMGGEALVDPVRYLAVRAEIRSEIQASDPT